jgi:hypothetical protein
MVGKGSVCWDSKDREHWGVNKGGIEGKITSMLPKWERGFQPWQTSSVSETLSGVRHIV